jgi:hypothetical protein
MIQQASIMVALDSISDAASVAGSEKLSGTFVQSAPWSMGGEHTAVRLPAGAGAPTHLASRLRSDPSPLRPARTDRAAWHRLSEGELNELVAQLVRSGEDLEAAQLLKRRYGYSATEAHKVVEEQASRI